MGIGLKLRRGATCTLKAILLCHMHRVAPTLTTVFEIVALAGHLLPKTPQQQHGGAGATGTAGAVAGAVAAAAAAAAAAAGGDGAAAGGAGRKLAAVATTAAAAAVGAAAAPQAAGARPRPVWVVAVATGALHMAHGFAPAVVVAQAVRLAANLVREAEQRRNGEIEDDRGTTEVRALQLGLSNVPRVDPRVPRSLDDYAAIYREWLLLLRGRLQQQSLELPPECFDEGDNELMRYALCYSVLQARSLKEALIAMDKTLANVRDFVAWWPKYSFLSSSDLEAWGRITWWEGPDREGRLWLMIDNRAAVNASRTHGAEAVARVVISNVEYGIRTLIPEYGCLDTINCVIDNQGVPQAPALRMRSAYQRVSQTLERFYPSRLNALWLVNLPFPLRVGYRTVAQFLMGSTRQKVKVAKPREVPCRTLPSALRSHKLSTAAGLDTWGYAAGDSAAAAVAAVAQQQHHQQHGGGGGGGGGGGEADAFSDIAPLTPLGRTPRRGAPGGLGAGGLGGAAGRGGGGAAAAAAAGAQHRAMVLVIAMAAVLVALMQREVLLPALRAAAHRGLAHVAAARST